MINLVDFAIICRLQILPGYGAALSVVLTLKARSEIFIGEGGLNDFSIVLAYFAPYLKCAKYGHSPFGNFQSFCMF